MLINFPSKTHLPQPKEKHLAQDVFKSNIKERERECESMPCPKCCFQRNWHSRAINKLLKNFSWKWKKIWASIHENCIRIHYTTYHVIIHILLSGFCSNLVYIINCKFITVKFSKVTHHEILSKEEVFSEFNADTLLIKIRTLRKWTPAN